MGFLFIFFYVLDWLFNKVMSNLFYGWFRMDIIIDYIFQFEDVVVNCMVVMNSDVVFIYYYVMIEVDVLVG